MEQLLFLAHRSLSASRTSDPSVKASAVAKPSSYDDLSNNRTSALEEHEEEHAYDAWTTLWLNVTIIGCLLLAYCVKKFRIYALPESAGALLVGVVVGGIARLTTDKTQLFEFSPEVFFFVLLPPIIFEAGYSLKRKDFFNNIGAITLYAVFGTIISAFVVGGLCFMAARIGLIRNIDADNPMEALLFGALIAAVDPVATLSILGSADLQCHPLLYSLVFGESVLNDAIAISLFNVFAQYYDPDGPDFTRSQIPHAMWTFIYVSGLSIVVGVVLGLTPSFLYRHTTLSDFPRLETSLLFTFCYLCYSTGEALGLSGIMALFFQGMVLSHYNSYNLSRTAHVASEQIFATLATIAETAVFLYMGMGVFTGRFSNFDPIFAVLALAFCVVGRFFNIIPLSWLSNLCRSRHNRITCRMQCVLWFAGLRGAIAFALAMNMPGKHRDDYATTTLFICIFTTVVCGGMTDRVLTLFGMRQDFDDESTTSSELGRSNTNNGNGKETYRMIRSSTVISPRSDDSGMRPDYNILPRRLSRHHHVYKGAKRLWKQLDDDFLKVYFGGSNQVSSASANGIDDDHLGNYELGNRDEVDDDPEGEEGMESGSESDFGRILSR